MPEIHPSIRELDILCAETRAPSCGVVVFGASGDLTRRKIVPSLLRLYQRDLLHEGFYLLGCGRQELSDVAFRERLAEVLNGRGLGPALREGFLSRFYYTSGSYDDPALYAALAERIEALDRTHGVQEAHVFYLAVPPGLYPTVVDHLGEAGLNRVAGHDCSRPPRLVVEKPFGRDQATAEELNDRIGRHFAESQVYRIDHYLGKETVQNILMFRFANTIFEPVWNRNFVDHVQLTIAESVGVEHRAGYYDTSGALRDMFQNHMLQMLTLATMEPPASFDAEAIRDEKVKLLRSIRPVRVGDPWGSDILRARYTAGRVDGRDVPGYLDERGVQPDSQTETFVAARLFVDNWRWKDVPFYLRTGKRLARKLTEVAITFKQVPHSMFASVGLADMPANQLILKIQPDEGIALSFQAKRPGAKTCISTLTMSFNYSELFGTEAPEAYERLLLDCMLGDPTLFSRQDAVQVSWALLAGVLEAWAKGEVPLHEYPAGSQSFAEADRLIQADGRLWRPLGDF